jgi:hypothetical protein
MVNIQMMPGDGCKNPCPVNGRSYAAALGAVISVPDFDAGALESNGWVRTAMHGSGATAGRPTTGLFKGYEYFDSSLGINVIWDGKVWRSHVTGAVV